MPAPLRRSFDYLPPASGAVILPGMRVRVPWGKRHSIGVVIEAAPASDLPLERLKPITATLDASPLLPPALLALLREAAAYYHHPIGDVVATALPAPLRAGRGAEIARESVWRLVPKEGVGTDAAKALKRSARRAALLELLAAHPDGIALRAIGARISKPGALLRTLASQGMVACVPAPEAARLRLPPSTQPPTLSGSQLAAADALRAALGQFACCVLHGVTGSGKTEVYLHAIGAAVAGTGQALVLVPEIGLAPQIVARIEARLGVPAAVMHSSRTDRERADAWLRARSGEARVIVGTRSAVFAPFHDLRLIVVDEEHDASYKQQDGFRYSARDLAVLRGARSGVPVILGSATPSLETLANVDGGRYRLLALPARAGSAVLPQVTLLDARRLAARDGLVAPLVDAIRARLDRGEQSLVFINRRGFAPVWMCHACGWVANCARCDARMTLHRAANLLRCHHCAAPRAGRQHGCAHRVPDVHEGHRSRGDGAGGGRHHAGRAQGGKIVADAAALLHGERAFLQRLENVFEVVGDFAHHEAVEQRDMAAAAGTGENAAGGQETETVQQRVEALGPDPGRIAFGLRDRLRHPLPAGADAGLAGGAVACLPDQTGDLHAERVVRLHRGAMERGV